MNVKSPKKRVPTAKGNRQKSILDLPTDPLIGTDIIPKQRVGADQTNQLEFSQENDRIFSPISKQTYINNNVYQENLITIPTSYLYIDENPFDLFPEDLFDDLLSEDDILTQSETNQNPITTLNEEIPQTPPEEVYQPNEDSQSIEEILEEEYEESSPQEESLSQEESSISIYKNDGTSSVKPIYSHPLKPIVEKWLIQKKYTGKRLSTEKTKINKFIQFLSHKKIRHPTSEHIFLYYQELCKNNTTKYVKQCMSIVRAFFNWTEAEGFYENIAKGTARRLCPKKTPFNPQTRNPNLNKTNDPQKQRATVTIHDMERAQFLYNQAIGLIDNELVFFKKWIESLDFDSTDAKKKILILKFAHFLYSENRIAPTQQDIIDFCKKYLISMGPATVNKYMLTIKHFFEWTEQNKIYPNITVNINTLPKGTTNSSDILILPNENKMQYIPNPTHPLICKKMK